MKRIGIDAGGTLIKLAYYEHDKLHVKTYPNHQSKELIKWLQLVSPNALLRLTGGNSGHLKENVNQKLEIVDEFQAIVSGTEFLLQKETVHAPREFILVSMGTGTSIFHVTADGFERMFGSGIGGGTLMGLGNLLTGKSRFGELIELASQGNYQKSDLLVRDIYSGSDAPLLGDLTAANFGKAHVNDKADDHDHMSSLIQLIGETTLVFAQQAAIIKQARTIVFVGGTLNDNKPLQNLIKRFEDMFPYEFILPSQGAYAGAIGTLMI